MLSLHHAQIERFIFVCPDLQKAFFHTAWNNFCLSPIRQIRPFLCVRYVSFQNILLEVLQVSNEHDAGGFVFFNEWKKASKPLWVAVGYKTENMSAAIDECITRGINGTETITRNDKMYSKGFRHQSVLLDYSYLRRKAYLTEYDPLFFEGRHNVITPSPDLKAKYYVNSIECDEDPSINESAKIYLNTKQDHNSQILDLDWLKLSLAIQHKS